MNIQEDYKQYKKESGIVLNNIAQTLFLFDKQDQYSEEEKTNFLKGKTITYLNEKDGLKSFMLSRKDESIEKDLILYKNNQNYIYIDNQDIFIQNNQNFYRINERSVLISHGIEDGKKNIVELDLENERAIFYIQHNENLLKVYRNIYQFIKKSKDVDKKDYFIENHPSIKSIHHIKEDNIQHYAVTPNAKPIILININEAGNINNINYNNFFSSEFSRTKNKEFIDKTLNEIYAETLSITKLNNIVKNNQDVAELLFDVKFDKKNMEVEHLFNIENEFKELLNELNKNDYINDVKRKNFYSFYEFFCLKTRLNDIISFDNKILTLDKNFDSNVLWNYCLNNIQKIEEASFMKNNQKKEYKNGIHTIS